MAKAKQYMASVGRKQQTPLLPRPSCGRGRPGRGAAAGEDVAERGHLEPGTDDVN